MQTASVVARRPKWSYPGDATIAVLSMWEGMGGASHHHFYSVSARILKNCPKTVWQILADSFFLVIVCQTGCV